LLLEPVPRAHLGTLTGLLTPVRDHMRATPPRPSYRGAASARPRAAQTPADPR
jgi:hypothetical protein